MENKGDDELSEKILQKVKTAKQNVLLRKKYMEYERQRAYDILQGEQKKAEEDAIAFLKEGDSVEKVARCIKLPVERVMELAEQLKA